MSDYSCGYPLWTAEGAVTPDELGLSHELAEALLEWQDLFDGHFHYERLWDGPAHAGRYAERAEPLACRLRHELGDNWVVVVDLWPVRVHERG
jgi:hypothetical protein